MSEPPGKRYKLYLDKGSRKSIPRSTVHGRKARSADAASTSQLQSDPQGTASSSTTAQFSGNSPSNSPPESDGDTSSSPSDESDDDTSSSDNPSWSGGHGTPPDPDDDVSSENGHPSDDDPSEPEDEIPIADPPDPEPEFPDYYNLNDPIEPNVTLTKFEVLVMIIHFAIRFGLSDRGIKALITLINSVLGFQVIPPSNYIFKKIFSSETKIHAYLYCAKCQLYLGKKEDCGDIQVCPAPECGAGVDAKSLNKGHFFMTVSVEDQIRERLKTDGENLLSYAQNTRNVDPEKMTDYCDGISFGKLQSNVPENSSFVTTSWCTDGAEIFSNTIFSMWAIQFFLNEVKPLERFIPTNILLAGVWFGKSGPSLSTYLTPLIAELQKLGNEGITWFRPALDREEVTRVFALNWAVDTIAKCKLMNMIQFNGYNACYFCNHPGDSLPHLNNQVRYGYRPTYGERAESLRQSAVVAEETGEDRNGVLGMSPLHYFPNFILPWGVVIDVMHSHFLGVTKYLCTSIWLNSAYHDRDFYLNPAKVSQIDKRIQSLHPPSNIARDLRPFSKCSTYKANEWRSWLFFYGPVCLQELLPMRYFRNFCKLSAAIYFFCQSSIDRLQIAFHGDLLTSFVQEFQELYGINHMTYNVHSSVHVKECVTSNGPLWCYSLFPPENGNRFLALLATGAHGVQQQITRRYCCYSSIPKIVSAYPPLSDIVTDFCDTILSLRRFKIISQGADNIYIVGNKFRMRFIPSPEEANSLIEALPELAIDRIFTVKKIIHKGIIYTGMKEKQTRRDDTCAKLSDGKIVMVKKLFISSIDNFNQVYVLGKQLRFQNNGRAIFHLDNFHLRICEPYRFEDGLVIVPATVLEAKCFFMSFREDLCFVGEFPNRYERN